VPPQPPEPIHLPDHAWTAPDVQAMCANADGRGLLRWAHNRYGISQGRIAHWTGLGSGEVSNLINEVIGPVTKLDRWRRIADALNMPAANRLLVMGYQAAPPTSLVFPVPDTPQPAADERRTDSDPAVGRRQFLAFTGAVATAAAAQPASIDAIETIRRQATRLLGSSTVSDAVLQDWDATVAGHGMATRHAPAHDFLASLVADFTELQGQLEHRQPARVQLHLSLIAAQLAGLVSLTLTKLGAHGPARNWGRTAWIAAQESGAADVLSWVRAQESYAVYYARSDPRASIDVARHAQQLAGAVPTVGGALAAALEARAHAQTGDRQATIAAIAAAEDILAGLNGDQLAASAFGYNEAQLRFHEGNAFTYLGETDRAWTAQDRALALYPRDDLDRTLIHLDRSLALASNGDTTNAATQTTRALLELPPAHRGGIVLQRAHEILGGLLASGVRPTPQLTELRDVVTASQEHPGGAQP
jgi:hypothetical protein